MHGTVYRKLSTEHSHGCCGLCNIGPKLVQFLWVPQRPLVARGIAASGRLWGDIGVQNIWDLATCPIRVRFNIMTVIPGISISFMNTVARPSYLCNWNIYDDMYKDRYWSRDHLISIMGASLLVRWNLYIETTHWYDGMSYYRTHGYTKRIRPRPHFDV